jgi:hypothetical protein
MKNLRLIKKLPQNCLLALTFLTSLEALAVLPVPVQRPNSCEPSGPPTSFGECAGASGGISLNCGLSGGAVVGTCKPGDVGSWVTKTRKEIEKKTCKDGLMSDPIQGSAATGYVCPPSETQQVTEIKEKSRRVCGEISIPSCGMHGYRCVPGYGWISSGYVPAGPPSRSGAWGQETVTIEEKVTKKFDECKPGCPEVPPKPPEVEVEPEDPYTPAEPEEETEEVVEVECPPPSTPFYGISAEACMAQGGSFRFPPGGTMADGACCLNPTKPTLQNLFKPSQSTAPVLQQYRFSGQY